MPEEIESSPGPQSKASKLRAASEGSKIKRIEVGIRPRTSRPTTIPLDTLPSDQAVHQAEQLKAQGHAVDSSALSTDTPTQSSND